MSAIPLAIQIAPVVVAAIISGLIAVAGILVTTRNAKALHKERLAADLELTRTKVVADLDLAERKFIYDKSLAAWLRHSEFAEQVLADFYQAKDAFAAIRSPLAFDSEGAARPKREGETAAETRRKNAYYAPVARMNAQSELFSRLYSHRHRFLAYFGEEAASAFADIHSVRVDIVTAAEALIEDDQNPKDFVADQKALLWSRGGKADPLSDLVKRAVEKVEQVVRPLILNEPSGQVRASNPLDQNKSAT